MLNHLGSSGDGDKLCHGDFHPGNVLLTEKGAVVIDWMTASICNPWADMARTDLFAKPLAQKARENEIETDGPSVHQSLSSSVLEAIYEFDP